MLTALTKKRKTMKMNNFDKIVWLLLIIGAFNWGLIGWLNFNLVGKIFGNQTMPSRVIYAIIGAASLYGIYRVIEMQSSPKKTK
jgi:uncharacterized membrane protein YuzA (DUF378 family)